VSVADADRQDWVRAWEAALEALEVDLGLAEQMLALRDAALDPPDPWQPPVGLGPLPAELADRARALLERQLETARRMGEAAALARRHARAAQGMRARGESAPVYVDTPA
jgi:hypothetical protein